MRYCDHHGWRWEPGQGPSPCIGETTSFVLGFAIFVYAVMAIRGVHQGLHRVVYNVRSCAYAVHAFQMVLCVAQAALAVAGGMLIARSRGMLCVALSLHSATWAVSWSISAFALLYNPASSKRLMWFWCCALISNRCDELELAGGVPCAVYVLFAICRGDIVHVFEIQHRQAVG